MSAMLCVRERERERGRGGGGGGGGVGCHAKLAGESGSDPTRAISSWQTLSLSLFLSLSL